MIQNIYTSFDTEYKKTKKTKNPKKNKILSSLFNYITAPRLMLSYHREDLIQLPI